MRLTRPVAFFSGAVGLLACVAHSESFPVAVDSASERREPRPPSPAFDFETGLATADPGSLEVETGFDAVLDPIPGSPEVAVCATYGVGGRDDPSGRSGLAELVQLLTEESGRSPDGADYLSLIHARGGSVENRTTSDFTQYCTRVAPTDLELAFGTEAARVREIVLSQQALDRARARLRERRARSLEAYGLGMAKLRALSFQGYAAYAPSPAPDDGGLASLTQAEVREFHARYYQPGNVVVSVSGRFEPDHVEELIRKYLDPGRARDRVRRARLAAFPRQTSERFLVTDTSGIETPAIYLGWTLSDPSPRDLAVLSVVGALLGGGSASALPHQLGATPLLAAPADAWREGHEGPELFCVRLIAAKGVRLATIEQAFEATVARLQQAGPTPLELERAREAVRGANSRGEELSLKRAERAGELRRLPRNGQAEQELASVTREDVRRVLVRDLARTHRVVVELYPPEMLKPPAVPPQRFHVVTPGETLTGIARRYRVRLGDLAHANELLAKKAIFPGQKLRLPAGARLAVGAKKASRLRVHRVIRGDTLIGIAKRYGVSARDLARANGQNPKKPLRLGQQLTVP